MKTAGSWNLGVYVKDITRYRQALSVFGLTCEPMVQPRCL